MQGASNLEKHLRDVFYVTCKRNSGQQHRYRVTRYAVQYVYNKRTRIVCEGIMHATSRGQISSLLRAFITSYYY